MTQSTRLIIEMGLKKISAFFVFFFFASLVYAQDYSLHSGKFQDFQEQGKIEFEFFNGIYAICEHEKKFLPILVVNKDNAQNSYELDVSGVSWAKLNVEQFSLPAKQTGAVFLELNPLQNSNGRYVIGISSLSSIGNSRKALNLDVSVERCYSIRLEIQDQDITCGGIKRQYAGEIVNDGKANVTVNLSALGPNWISLNNNFFRLNADQKEIFTIDADVPPNAKGIFNVFLRASISGTPVKSERKIGIDVTPKFDCYKAEIISSDVIENEYSSEFIPVRIRNSGIKQAVYEASLEGPAWASISPKQLIVNPGKISSLNLNINPEQSISEGKYPVRLDIKYEDMVYSRTISIELSRNRFFKSMKSFLIFYQYYIYVIFIILAIAFIFRNQILNGIKSSYKNYKTRNSRLKALKAARSARALKSRLKQLEKGIEKGKKKRYNKLVLFFAAVSFVFLALMFLIYQFDFPIKKDFVRENYPYIIAGILISIFIIFLIEFYKPLFRQLRKIK